MATNLAATAVLAPSMDIVSQLGQNHRQSQTILRRTTTKATMILLATRHGTPILNTGPPPTSTMMMNGTLGAPGKIRILPVSEEEILETSLGSSPSLGPPSKVTQVHLTSTHRILPTHQIQESLNMGRTINSFHIGPSGHGPTVGEGHHQTRVDC